MTVMSDLTVKINCADILRKYILDKGWPTLVESEDVIAEFYVRIPEPIAIDKGRKMQLSKRNRGVAKNKFASAIKLAMIGRRKMISDAICRMRDTGEIERVDMGDNSFVLIIKNVEEIKKQLDRPKRATPHGQINRFNIKNKILAKIPIGKKFDLDWLIKEASSQVPDEYALKVYAKPMKKNESQKKRIERGKKTCIQKVLANIERDPHKRIVKVKNEHGKSVKINGKYLYERVK